MAPGPIIILLLLMTSGHGKVILLFSDHDRYSDHDDIVDHATNAVFLGYSLAGQTTSSAELGPGTVKPKNRVSTEEREPTPPQKGRRPGHPEPWYLWSGFSFADLPSD